MSLRPLIAICGTTGVGKSKLAIELAISLSQSSERHQHGYRGARIINADAMQVYAGMDIITNKVPTEEQCGVDHLLMGFKRPGEQYVVGQWVRDALQLIEETHQRNQIPIIVGGTSYWIQHLIFPNRLVTSFDGSDEERSRSPSPSRSAGSPHLTEFSKAVASLTSEQLALFDRLPEVPPTATAEPDATFALHQLLAALDPVVAQRWHWKDSRKVIRSLEIMKESGRLSSEIIKEQSTETPPPRFRTLCFWLYARPEVLNPLLDARVDDMIRRGLLKEVEDLRNLSRTNKSRIGSSFASANEDSPDTDYTLGIYQSIGYREFHKYLSTHPSDRAYQDALQRMKLSTRKYAKKQVSWLRNKLLPAVRAANVTSNAAGGGDIVPTFLLDASELGDSWEHGVQAVAENITNDFLSHHDLPDPLELSDVGRNMLSAPDKPTMPEEVLSARRKVVCPVCTINTERPVMIEEGREWTAHTQTRMHRRLASKKDVIRKTGPDPREDRRSGFELGDPFEGLRSLLRS